MSGHPFQRSRRRPLLVAASAVALACSGSTEPDEYLVMGTIIGYQAGDPQITVPDTVSGGGRFAVAILTYGNSCHRVGPTETTVDSLGHTVTVFDYHSTSGICTDILNIMVHAVALPPGTPGSARTITFRGFDALTRDTVEVVREVWVE